MTEVPAVAGILGFEKSQQSRGQGHFRSERYLLVFEGQVPLVDAGFGFLGEGAAADGDRRTPGAFEELEVELAGFARSTAVHHPGMAICDLAVMLAGGGVCPADVVMLRARPHLFGLGASDPTISRIIDDLACDVGVALTGIATARAHTCTATGLLPDVDEHVIIGIDPGHLP